jgi:importin subunit beta-1
MLGNEDHTVIKAAATCVAAIAVIEVPQQQWPEIIPLLSENAVADDINVRLASLQTLGFICEDINPTYLAPENMNQILSAVLMNVFP